MIVIKSESVLDKMRFAGNVAKKILAKLEESIAPGITTLELDRIASKMISDANCTASFKGYNGFPSATCISVNEMLIHGYPSSYRLKEGDIVSIDLGVCYLGYHVDCARTYGVGKISAQAQIMIDVAKTSLDLVKEKIRAGHHIGDIGKIICSYVTEQNLYVAKDYCGHGVGRDLHEDPLVPNYGEANKGVKISPRMTLAIEPMILLNSSKTKVIGDFEVYPLDGGLTSHYEDTIVFYEDHIEVLTGGSEIV